MAKVVAPATKGGPPPKGGIYIGAARRPSPSGWFQQNAFGFISRNRITMISGLRPLSPFGAFGTTFPPAKAGEQQPVLYLEPLMNTKVRGALLSHRLRGEGGGVSHQRGAAAERRHTKWRHKAPYLANAVVLHNSLGGALKLPVRRSRSQAEPWQPRGESPGGAINPRGEAASAFGNTAKRRFLPKSPTPQVSHTAKKH